MQTHSVLSPYSMLGRELVPQQDRHIPVFLNLEVHGLDIFVVKLLLLRLGQVGPGQTEFVVLHHDQEPGLFQGRNEAPIIGIAGNQQERIYCVFIMFLAGARDELRVNQGLGQSKPILLFKSQNIDAPFPYDRNTSCICFAISSPQKARLHMEVKIQWLAAFIQRYAAMVYHRRVCLQGRKRVCCGFPGL